MCNRIEWEKTKTEWKVESFHMSPVFTYPQIPINILHQSGLIVTMDKPTVIYYYHSKSTVYIRGHSFIVSSIGFDKI